MKDPRYIVTLNKHNEHALVEQFPARESDEYDAGYTEAKRDCARIIKDFYLK